MLKFKTVRDVDVANKTVIVRAPLNVPIKEGKVEDMLRLDSALPTLKFLLNQNCKLVLLSHHSREGQSLKPVASVLSELLGQQAIFLDDCIGEKIVEQIKDMPNGSVAVCENVRFHPEEEKNDSHFAKELSKLGSVYINDDFTVMHRDHASVTGITEFLPSAAGLQVEKEVTTITEAVEKPKHPLVAIIGGAKISTKIEVLDSFMKTANTLIIGGAMANNFFKEMGYNIGKSHFDPAGAESTKKILEAAKTSKCKVYIPDKDVLIGLSTDANEKAETRNVTGIKDNEIILDLGPETMKEIAALVQPAKTVIWNGTLGMTELAAFRGGSKLLAKAIIDSGATSIVGGGDTDGFISEEGLHDKFSFVSTGGGASLDLMAGKPMPGLEALQAKS